jgi:hypothetical protein
VREELAAVNATDSEPSDGVMPEIVGAVGGPVGVSGPDGDEKEPWPTELTAATSNSYAVPFVSDPTMHDVAVPVHDVAVVHDV